MSDDDPLEQHPLRIATSGTCEAAIFHLESAAFRDALHPVVAARLDANVGKRDVIPGCPSCDKEELINCDVVDVVFVCGESDSRARRAIELLRAGHHVVIEPTSVLTPEQIAELNKESDAVDRCCLIWRRFEGDENFQQALHVVGSGEAGDVTAVRFTDHDMDASVFPEDRHHSPRAPLHRLDLADLMADRLSQLLSLIAAKVERHASTIRNPPVIFGTDENAREVTSKSCTAICSHLEFEGGKTAIVDIGRAFVAPIRTGWIVQSTAGGFQDGRQFITVEDGEIYDVAVEVEPFDSYEWLAAVIRDWGSHATRAEVTARLKREIEVARLAQQIVAKL